MIEIAFTREDLLPEYRDDPVSTIQYKKLGATIRNIVKLAGRAKFVDHNLGSYNMVYAPVAPTKNQNNG